MCWFADLSSDGQLSTANQQKWYASILYVTHNIYLIVVWIKFIPEIYSYILQHVLSEPA